MYIMPALCCQVVWTPVEGNEFEKSSKRIFFLSLFETPTVCLTEIKLHKIPQDLLLSAKEM